MQMPNEVKEIEKDTKPEKSPVFSFSIKRVFSGVEIFLKSSEIEKMMISLSKGKTWRPAHRGDVSESIELDGNAEAYDMGNKSIKLPSGKNVFGAFAHGLFHGPYFNARLLTLKGLSDGITIKIAQPYGNEQLETIRKQVEETVKEIFTEFLKPAELSLDIYLSDKEGKKSSPPTTGERLI